MKESIMHYLHIAPLFIIIALSIANQVFKTKKLQLLEKKPHWFTTIISFSGSYEWSNITFSLWNFRMQPMPCLFCYFSMECNKATF